MSENGVIGILCENVIGCLGLCGRKFSSMPSGSLSFPELAVGKLVMTLLFFSTNEFGLEFFNA